MKYCKEITDKICESIKSLKGRIGSCKEAGISYETFLHWTKTKNEFSLAIKKAEEEAGLTGKEVAIMSIFRAMPTQWQAAAWWLERKHNFVQKVNQTIDADVKITDGNARKKLVSKLASIASSSGTKQSLGGTD